MEGGQNVDNPNNGKTITIKINGKDRPFQEKNEDKKKEAWKPKDFERKENNEETEFFASIQTAAGKEADDSFDWILPEETEDSEIKEFKVATPPKSPAKKGFSTLAQNFKKKNNQGFLTSIFLAVFFAVLLGTSFGFIMLKLVFTDQAAETVTPAVTETPAASREQAGTETAALDPLATFVVQGGVFSNNNAAKQIQEANAQKGADSHLIEIGGQTFLYLGVSDNIEHAKEMGADLKSKGIDVFAKEITFDAKSIDGLNAVEKKLLEIAPSLYHTLSAGAANATVEKSIPEGLVEDIKKQRANLNELQAGQIKNQALISIKEELENASKQIETFQESGDAASASKVQQHLLAFLAAYQSL
jgi:stage II sporulation protein B